MAVENYYAHILIKEASKTKFEEKIKTNNKIIKRVMNINRTRKI